MDRNIKPRLFYGHVVVAASFAVQWICLGTLSTYGVFFKHLVAEFGWSRATISGAFSLAVLFIGLVGIIAGRLNDRFGPRIIMAASGIFLGLGYLLMSQLQAPWQIYLFYGVIVGIGMSTNDIVTLSTVARWFVQKRGIMTGIVKLGTGVGQLLTPLLASVLIVDYGWRTSYVIIGSAVMFLLAAITHLLRRDPQQMGLWPDGETNVTMSASESEEEGLLLRDVISTKQLWALSLAYFSIMFCLLTITVHIVPHATDIGISETNAVGILSTIGGVSMAGRFAMGTASDRIGYRRAMIICFIVLITSLLWLQVARELWMLYLFALIYGFAHGGFLTLVSPLTARLFGTKAHGAIFGIVCCVGMVGGAIGLVLAGHIFDITKSYQLVFWISTGLNLAGLLLILLLKPVAIK